MVKAVIFDCFGVLTTDGWKVIRDEYFSHDNALSRRALDLDKAVNAGMMEYKDFIDEVAEMTGLNKTEVFNRISTSHVPNDVLFDYIRDKLKPAYKIGMLSNAAENWLDDLFQKDQIVLFDQTLLSYEIGVTKPDSHMYETIASRLGVTNEECLFIDDQLPYVDGAQQVGMKAIHFEDTKHAIAKIEELIHA